MIRYTTARYCRSCKGSPSIKNAKKSTTKSSYPVACFRVKAGRGVTSVGLLLLLLFTELDWPASTRSVSWNQVLRHPSGLPYGFRASHPGDSRPLGKASDFPEEADMLLPRDRSLPGQVDDKPRGGCTARYIPIVRPWTKMQSAGGGLLCVPSGHE